jgi:hypothetical protein
MPLARSEDVHSPARPSRRSVRVTASSSGVLRGSTVAGNAPHQYGKVPYDRPANASVIDAKDYPPPELERRRWATRGSLRGRPARGCFARHEPIGRGRPVYGSPAMKILQCVPNFSNPRTCWLLRPYACAVRARPARGQTRSWRGGKYP